MTLFSLILCEATRVVDLMGEVGVVVFLLGGWTLAPRRKFENFDLKFKFFILSQVIINLLLN